jgi:hypothetical protein
MLCARLGVGEFRVQTDPVESELYCQSGHQDRPAGSEQLHVVYDAVMPGAMTNLNYSSDQHEFEAVYSNLFFFFSAL